MIISDRFADELRAELARLIQERKEILVKQTTERRAGQIEGLIEALEVANATIRKLNEK